VLAWTVLLGRVGTELTRAIAVALGRPEDHFDAAFAGEPHWFGKLIRYVGRPTDGPEAQGVGPHADWGFLTLLLQDGTGGLQARPPRAPDWIDVPALDGALVINVGEMLEVATRGYLGGHRPSGAAVRARRHPAVDRHLLVAAAGRHARHPCRCHRHWRQRAPGVSQHEHNTLLPRSVTTR